MSNIFYKNSTEYLSNYDNNNVEKLKTVKHHTLSNI